MAEAVVDHLEMVIEDTPEVQELLREALAESASVMRGLFCDVGKRAVMPHGIGLNGS